MSKLNPAQPPPASSLWQIPFPDPYPENEIKPVLQAFGRGGKTVTLKYGTTPSETVDTLARNNLLGTHQVVFIVHGFRNDLQSPWMPKMKDAILEVADDTVILVGWEGGANLAVLHYWQAASNTQVVGSWLGTHAKALKEHGGPSVWGIGHSLGAHVLGKAGRDSGAFKRITGLSPAGPSFEQVNQDKRLNPGAAELVDVIHTDGFEPYSDPEDWFSPVNHYGTLIPLGHVDFYPNFGTSDQPGCGIPIVDGIACSHHRAIELFTWSISNPDKFKTDQILKTAPQYRKPVKELHSGPFAQMGYYAEKGHCQGSYYLRTNAQ